jgi:hypothetical protein
MLGDRGMRCPALLRLNRTVCDPLLEAHPRLLALVSEIDSIFALCRAAGRPCLQGSLSTVYIVIPERAGLDAKAGN